jgi:hypothetical protein
MKILLKNTMTLKLCFRGKRPIQRPRTRWFSQVIKYIEMKGNSWQEIHENSYGKIRERMEYLGPSTCIKQKRF